jgi:hypothetical protein
MTPGITRRHSVSERIDYAARTLRATAAPSATRTKSNNNFFTKTSSAGWSRHCTGGATGALTAVRACGREAREPGLA